MLLTTLAFLFIAFFRMTLPSTRKKNHVKNLRCLSVTRETWRKLQVFPLGVEVWPYEFGCSNTVLQESLGATPLNQSAGLKSLLKFNACHGEKLKFFQIVQDREMSGGFHLLSLGRNKLNFVFMFPSNPGSFAQEMVERPGSKRNSEDSTSRPRIFQVHRRRPLQTRYSGYDGAAWADCQIFDCH